MKEETVTAMNLAGKARNKAWDELCVAASDVADIALKIERGEAKWDEITRYLRDFEKADAAYLSAQDEHRAAMDRWQDEFDKREQIHK